MTVETLYSFDENQSPPVKLFYFGIPGKGEGIRQALYHSRINFIDVRLDRESFTKMKTEGELSFGQVPALLTADGKHLLVQSAAILRYIGKVGKGPSKLYPDDPLEAAKVDAALDQLSDMSIGKTVSTYHARFGFKFLGQDSYKHLVGEIRQSLADDILPSHLRALEATIEKSVGPWLASQTSPTIADFAAVTFLKSLQSFPGGTGPNGNDERNLIEAFPKLIQLIASFDELEAAKQNFAKE